MLSVVHVGEYNAFGGGSEQSDTLIRVLGDMALVLSCPHLPTVVSGGLISHPSLL